MPAVPSCPLEPLWQFAALLPVREGHAAGHPLGFHRRRVSDRVVFEHVVLALVHGSGYERIASPGCSDLTIRRRVKQRAELGIAQRVHPLALEAYDRMIGLGPAEVSVDGCITKAPSGGDKAGRSPVDRGKLGLWARLNSAHLRQLAGQISTLDNLGTGAQNQITLLREALAHDDASRLLRPLADASPHLQPTHPALATLINTVTEHTDQLRRDTQALRQRE
ncbi:hypothetical protein ABIA33_007609 [Streptacidiphilus sp. MAP12-16]